MLATLPFGARAGRLSPLKRWLVKTGFRTLKVFVVPGADVLRALGLELAPAGLEIARTPREADVLLITGPLPAGLAENAAVIFAQLPRPRLLAVMGELETAPLPAPDIRLPLSQAGLLTLGPEARRLLTAHAWDPAAKPFAPAFIEKAIAQQDKGGHEGHGNMDHGGMDMREEMEGMDHGSMKHGAMGHAGTKHQPATAAAPPHGQREHHPMPPEAEKPPEREPADEPAAGDRQGPTATHHQHPHLAMPMGEATEPQAPPAADLPQPNPHAGHHDPHHLASPPAEPAPQSPVAHAGHDHAAMTAGPMPHAEGMNMPGMAADPMPHKEGMNMPATNTGPVKQEDGGEMSGMDMSGDMAGMDMSGGVGFMSMVSMTKDLPRSADGLPMEATDAAFGPFFPGLPGGLHLRLHLDGDTVTKAVMKAGPVARNFAGRLPVPVSEFAGWLAGLDPLAPVTYRLLAHRALARATAPPVPERVLLQQLGQLEQERIASHLNWLIGFSVTIGHSWLHLAAERLYQQLRRGAARPADVAGFGRKVRRLPLLRGSLVGIGPIPGALLHHARGPVARAAGQPHDARLADPLYQGLGFQPIILEENNAWGRLLVRLEEMAQSQALLDQLGPLPVPPAADDTGVTGQGSATIETPRGTATLEIEVQAGQVAGFTLHTPSTLHVALANEFVREQELGDALKTIASLDISPWEIDQ